MADEERIALFIDFENLAIGARDRLGIQFDYGPVADALAERGRVVTRRAYGDWTMFDQDRKNLVRHHIDLIEIPQRMGHSRKNAADIKMAVDALELAFEREYVTTFVFLTGDSDFTPLVHKLREHNRRVIGVGIKASTSALLPAACDEFLFYENLDGVEPRKKGARPRKGKEANGDVVEAPARRGPTDARKLERLVNTTLAGLERNSNGPILASALKRALIRKDSTFSETEYGFRAFGELLRFLQGRKIIELAKSSARGDPEVMFPEKGEGEEKAFELLRDVVDEAEEREGPPPLSGLKNKLRRKDPEFSEKTFGFNGFLQFCKAAATRGYVELEWDDELDDYEVRVPEEEEDGEVEVEREEERGRNRR